VAFLYEISSIPIRRSPANRSVTASTSAETRVTIAPTVFQAIRIRWHTAVRDDTTASPRHRVIEIPGVPGAVPCPRHRRDHHPVLRAGHPRRAGLQLRPDGTQVQRPPPPPSLPAVIPAAPAGGRYRTGAARP
jgi:hypothetical protein